MLNKKLITKSISLILVTFCLLQFLVIDSNADENPEYQWIEIYNKSKDDKSFAVTTDNYNNIIITGSSKVGLYEKCYTVKYDITGKKILELVSDYNYESRAYDVTVDSQNNIIIGGCCNNNDENWDYYIIKYDENGNMQWNRSYDNGNDDIIYGIKTDSNDNIIVTGKSSDDFLTIKLDKFGSELWNISYDISDDDCSYSIDIDSSDNIIITGYIKTGSSRDWCTIKYDTNGIMLWQKILAQFGNDYSTGVSIDSNDNIIVTGTCYKSANSDISVIKYDQNGNKIWQRFSDNGVVEYAEDVVVNSWDEIIVVGSYTATFEKLNFAVIKYDSEGNHLWSTFYDGHGEDDCAKGVTIDNYNKIIMTGYSKDYHFENSFVTIKYGEKPIANFTYLPSNPTTIDNIQFKDTSRDPAGILVSWFWDFGDGVVSALQNPIHKYNEIGIKTVSLTVRDDDGFQDTISYQIRVLNALPIANFTYKLTGSIQDTILFNDSSTDIDGNIVSWSWDFGDGNFSTGKITTHNYKNEGIFNVTLTVTDDDGGTDKKSRMIVPPPPKIDGLQVNDAKDGKLDITWNPINGYAYFNYYNIYRDGSALTTTSTNFYRDTGLTNGQSYSYQISAVNIYNMEGEKSNSVSCIPTATSTNNGGATGGGGNSYNILKNKPPFADASKKEPYIGFIDEEITFDGSLSYDSDGKIIFYHWNFGDGYSSSNEITTHSFSKKGTYNVILTVTDDDGETDTYKTTAVIKIPNRPPTDPVITGTNEGTKKVFYNYSVQSFDLDNDKIKYYFDWDDDKNSSSEFLSNGTIEKQAHMWNFSGKYVIDVYTSDNESFSGTTNYVVFIDAVEIYDSNESAIGYLIDDDSDGIYDRFYSYIVQKETIIKFLGENKYLIDVDGDGKWDYLYDSESRELTPYKADSSQKQQMKPLLILIFILLLIFIIILLIFIITGKGKLRKRKAEQLLSLFLVLLFFPVLNKNKKNLNQDKEMASLDNSDMMESEDVEAFVDDLPDIEEP